MNSRRKDPNGKNSSVSEKEPPVSVMFCPQTPQGELAKRLREADKKLAEVTKDEVKIDLMEAKLNATETNA